jgi:gamma-glutamyl-gamma-aminobutyrate hydrolase PuuD
MPKAGLTFREPHKAEPYAEALRQAGIEPVLLSPDHPRDLAGLQGLVLSGGTDLNPARYGAAAQPEDEEPDDARDDLETGLLNEALASDLPVLAICRGLPLFNVAHGGTLIQHLANSAVHVVRGNDPALAAHQILVEPGSRLAAILGEGAHGVNSRHHQAVDKVGAGLRVTAKSIPDGVVEALERDDRRFALAVQWHPEDQVRRDAEQRKLFEAFGAEMS